MRWVQSIGLQQRIMLYVTLGLVTLVALFAFIALRAVNKSGDAILEERLVLAQTVSKDIDGLIQTGISQLESTAALLFTQPLEELSSHEVSMLQAMTQGLGGFPGSLGVPAHVLLVDRDGSQVWEGTRSEESELPENLLALQSEKIITTGSPSVQGRSLLEGPVPSVIVLGAPVIGPGGEIRGALTAVLFPNSANYALFVPSEGQEGNYRLELIDEAGIVVASSDEQHVGEPSIHLSISGSPLQTNRRGVWKHKAPSDDVSDHIVALAPLESIPWTVALEQDEDVALALPGSLARRIYLLAALTIPAALILAWITTRQVVRPLTRLTQTAGRIASGDLESPVAVDGQDEVRILARSFEVMRHRLKESVDDIASWNQQLESRVRNRTLELEQRNKERTQLLQKVITAQEEERKRVARDLHDMVGQALTGLGMALGSAEAEVDGDPQIVRERLSTLRSMTSATIEDVRRLIADLRPSVLDDLGLIQAVGWYIENYLEKAGITATFENSGSDEKIPPHVETASFRVIQETITNIIKHSRARNVAIKLDFRESEITGEVHDDGLGFDPNEVRREAADRDAVGLLGMEERTVLLGGSLKVSSEPGKGTTVTFGIPLERAKVT